MARKLTRRAFWRRFVGEGLAERLGETATMRVRVDDDEARLEELRTLGVSVSLIGGDSDKLVLRARNIGKAFGDEQMARLEPLTDRISWLDLGDTDIGDGGLAVVSRMTNLRRLYLQNTHVTDAGLAHLARLTVLNYLNLYGTDVSDAGLRHLHEIKALQSLFLWQTRATPTGAASLTAALPGLKVHLGTKC